MNRINPFAVAVFFLLFATFAWAQDPRDDSKPKQDEPKQEEARPDAKHDATPPSHQNEAQPPQQEEQKPSKDEMKPSNSEKESARPSHDENKPAHEEHGQEPERGQAAQSGEHARPSGKSVHIPDEKFKASFGRQHNFRVNQVINQTTVVAGQTQFIYGGYTFVVLDPWPSDWMFTDDCYIDYVDGDYFLIDLLHPGVRIALFVQG